MGISKRLRIASAVLTAVFLCMHASHPHALENPRVTMRKTGFTVHGAPHSELRAQISDLVNGRPIRSFRGHESYIRSIAFSPDGRVALSGGMDNTLRLWDVASGNSLRGFREREGSVHSAVFSPDGRQVLSGGKGSTLRLWDVENGAVLRVFQGHQYGVNSIAFSPDGKRALSGSDDDTMRLWDVRSGTVLHVFSGHEAAVSSVAFSPSGKQALSGSKDGTLRLWEVDSGRELRVFQGHKDSVFSVVFTPDGRQALSGGRDKTLRLWDIDSGEELRVFRGHKGWVWSVALSPNGKQALSGSGDDTVRLWDVESGDELRAFRENGGYVRSVAFSPDGRRALSGGGDNALRLWDPRRILPDSLDLEQMENSVQESVKEHFQNLIGLPDVVEKDPFESEEMYQRRAAEVAHSRNIRVGRIRRNIQQHRLDAYSSAVVNAQGHPILGALEDEAGRPKYEAETAQLHLSFRFMNSPEAWDWVFEVPAGEPVRTLYRALKRGDVPASAEYRLQGEIATLETVIAHYGNKTYRGSPAKDDFIAPKRRISIFGSGDRSEVLGQRRLSLETPLVVNNLFSDDIPELLSEARAAPVDNRKWLFVVGIEDYRDTHDIRHSKRTARMFARVAQKTLGISEKRTRLLLDGDATSGRIKDQMLAMLDDVREGDVIYFYYSGHGIPVPSRDNAAFILPQDALPDFVSKDKDYQVDRIYQQLTDSKASQVIAIMDSCFTGVTDGKSVFKGKKAATRLAPKIFRPSPTGKLAVLSAGTEKQYSNAYQDKGHRLFSYFVMRALLKGHKNIGDLGARVRDDVLNKTLDLGGGGLRQDPVLQGNPDLEI